MSDLENKLCISIYHVVAVLGIGMEGLGCILAGAWGTGSGTTSYSENIGAIGITKVNEVAHFNLLSSALMFYMTDFRIFYTFSVNMQYVCLKCMHGQTYNNPSSTSLEEGGVIRANMVIIPLPILALP